MNNGNPRRITRGQALVDEQLRLEVENFNPFQSRDRIPRENSRESISSVSDVSSDSFNNTLVKHDIVDDSTLEFSNIEINSTMVNTEGAGTSYASQPAMLQLNQTVSLKDAAEVVPAFDGKNIPLGQFLEGCSEAKDMVAPAAENNLVKLIRSKISGEARQSMLGKTFDSIEALKDHFKDIYAPVRSVNQLLGELGNEYQREDEKVLTFANRLREIASRILEAQRVIVGTVDDSFKSSMESNVFDCFKRGLKPEIGNKLTAGITAADAVKSAIKVEKELEAQKALRRGADLKADHRPFQKKFVSSCQLCEQEGHIAPQCKFVNKIDLTCSYCKMNGHNVDNCWKRNKDAKVKCQLCERDGHSAKNCQLANKCQVCKKLGHTADKCYFVNNQKKVPIVSQTQLSCQTCQKPGHTANNCRTSNMECFYCKRKGHVIADCYKRKNNINRYSGNGQNPQSQSAVMGMSSQMRSTKAKEVDSILCELLP